MWWFVIHIHCERITIIRLINTSLAYLPFFLFFWWEHFNSILLANVHYPIQYFQVCVCVCVCVCESRSVMSISFRPHLLYNPWNSLHQNTGAGSLSLLQGSTIVITLYIRASDLIHLITEGLYPITLFPYTPILANTILYSISMSLTLFKVPHISDTMLYLFSSVGLLYLV